MGQLAVAVGGAVIGGMFGFPQLGFMVGSLAGSFIFGSGQSSEGPRVDDLKVTGASYGDMIPFGAGTARLGGKIIWCPGIEEDSHKERAGKGGGPSVTTYTYSASFAALFCEGPIDRVLRIWADGKCIYDTTGQEDVISMDDLRWTLYKGTEEQLPSPVIEASEGAGRVPAFRGSCYIVFENMPLANFGNRIPTITAELTSAAVRSMPYVRTPNFDDFWKDADNDLWLPPIGDVDLNRRQVWLAMPNTQREFTPNTTPSLLVLDSDTMIVTQQIPLTSLVPEFPPSFWDGTGDNDHYTGVRLVGGLGDNVAVVIEGYGFDRWLISVSKDTFQRTSALIPDPTASGLQNAYHGRNECILRVGTGLTAEEFFFSPPISGLNALLISLNNSTVYQWNNWPSQLGRAGCTVVQNAEWGIANPSVALFTGSNLADDGDLKISIGRLQGSQIVADNEAGMTGIRTTLPPAAFYTIPQSVLGSRPTVVQAYYDERDGNYLILTRLQSSAVKVIKWSERDGVLWMKDGPAQAFVSNDTLGCFAKQRINGFLYLWGSNVLRINSITGEYETFTNPLGANADSYDNVFNTTSGGMAVAWSRHEPVGAPTLNHYVKIFLDRFSVDAGASVAAIIENVLGRVGIEPADLDLTDIDDTVFGYYASRVASAKDVIIPLASACQFDAVESDYVLKFTHRGKASVANLDQDDLQTLDDEGNVLEETTTQELELPASISIRYSDQDHAYNVGTQQARRPSSPVAVMGAQGSNPIETPVIMNATRAKQLAETYLYSAWNERSGYKYQPDPRLMALDPTDVVNMTLADGTSYRQRILKVVMGADLNLSWEVVGEDGATYTSTAIGDGGKLPIYPLPQIFSSLLVLLDVPYLRDQDVVGNEPMPMVYGAFGGYGRAGWRGAVAYEEQGAGTGVYNTRFTEVQQLSYGFCQNALPNDDSPWETDNDTELIVSMVSGADNLFSVTQLEMLNWANGAAVRSGSSWEIIQYREVEQIDETTFALRGLLRGRRGTDPFCNGHAPGDMFILLRPVELNPETYTTAQLNQAVNWKGASAGQYIEDVPPTQFVGTGANLKPYAPVHVKITESGADSVITWVRRTRFNGELRDGTGTVPLNEETELYSVDILDDNGNVIRTYDGLTSPTVTYTAGDKTADGVSVWAAVVYQISAVVGRGFGSRPVRPSTVIQVAKFVATAVVVQKPAIQISKLAVTALVSQPIDVSVSKLAVTAVVKE